MPAIHDRFAADPATDARNLAGQRADDRPRTWGVYVDDRDRPRDRTRFSAACLLQGVSGRARVAQLSRDIELRDRAIELYLVTVETRPWTTIFPLYRVGRFLEVDVEGSTLRGVAWLPLSDYRRGDVTDNRAAQRHWNIDLVPFFAAFQYCQLRSPLGIGLECQHMPPENVVVYNSCTSESATMTLTKR